MLSQLHYTKAHLQTGLQHTSTLGLGAIIFGDPHQRPVAGRVLRGLIPGATIGEGETRGFYSVTGPEDAALCERREQPFRDDPFVLQEMFQGPECELGVIGREPDRTTAGVWIWLVVPDGMSRVRKLPFGAVPKRVADRQRKQHAFHTDGTTLSAGGIRSSLSAPQHRRPALCDQLV
jgi:hypothetical protein